MFKIINPFDQTLVHEYRYTSLDECNRSIDLVFNYKSIQAEIPPHKRYLILGKLKALILEHKSEFSDLITKETGKVITESRGEVDRALVTVEISAEEAKRINGEVVNANSFGAVTDKISIIQKKPVGVILCITPFNFPLNLALHKIAPAFAAGNTILFKPSEHNYLSGKLLTTLCIEAGMNENSFQMIMPEVSVMETVVSSPKIHCISFTGGTKTADSIASMAGRKKLLFELGGNDPLVVCSDADIDTCVDVAITGRFGCAGQKCTSNKRVYVHQSIYKEFKDKLIDKTKLLVVGDPACSKTNVGPVISIQSAKNLESIIKRAIGDGATLLLGGDINGALVKPTILENINSNSDLINEETFGPILPLIPFTGMQEVIASINSTPYGLQAGIFTNNLTWTKDFYHQLDVGTVIVNDGPGFRQEHLPFGGVKSSGMGREGIRYAIDEMSYIKQLIL
jgi:acyl-CoA reductase-like NAD-dependent aldehyde dehydrogenase